MFVYVLSQRAHSGPLCLVCAVEPLRHHSHSRPGQPWERDMHPSDGAQRLLSSDVVTECLKRSHKQGGPWHFVRRAKGPLQRQGAWAS